MIPYYYIRLNIIRKRMKTCDKVHENSFVNDLKNHMFFKKTKINSNFFKKNLRKEFFVLNLHPHYTNGPWCNWQHVGFWYQRV